MQPNDLKEIISYKHLIFKFPIYTSSSTQQIYDTSHCIKSCDAKGRISVDVIDDRNKFSGFRYTKISRKNLLKANNDYDEIKEKEALYYRYFDENHQPFKQ